ncbi:MAG: hypothetical protein ABIH20_04310 [Candidatus Diapherotrites archaeon]
MWKYFGKIKEKHQITFTIIIGVAVISFWRGIWGLLDYFDSVFLPGKELLGYSISILLGIIILIASGYLIKELA